MGDAVDDYLASLDLWRKLTARDGTSLYRAVAEQLLHTQTLHEQVEEACSEYLRENSDVEDELCALSHIYKCEFTVYQLNCPPRTVSCDGCTQEVKLCKSDHYDSVYPVSFIESAAICQSIIYEVLYERVFRVDSVLEQSREMICNKTPNKFRGSGGGRFDYPPHPHVMSGDRHSPPSYNQDPTPAEAFGNRNSFPTPFPYKVAKALMPDIYRNMEFDAWNEAKKDQDEITCGEGDQQFACGDKCQVNLEGHPERVFNAHIQDIKSRKGPVVVFVLELGERHEVLLSSLIPLPQVHNQDIPNKRRSKKKDFSLVVPVPGRQQHSLPPRLCSQSSLGSKEASSDCSSPSGSMGRASSPAGFQTRPRSNFVKRHLINSAGHLIKGSWAPMNNRWWCGRTRPPHRGYFRFGRPEEEVAGNAYCHSPDYEDGQAQYSEEQRADSEAVLNIPLNRSNEECGASSQMMPPGVYPSAGGGPNVMPSPCVFPSTAACPAAPPGSSPTARGGSAFPPPPPNYLASSPPYSYFIVPYHESMVHGGAGPVNYAAAPSYDPSGMDLPQRDMSTLRFFFNLGVEYYHMCSYLQQQQHQQRFMASFAPPPPVTYSVPIQSGQQPQRSCEQLTSVPPPPLIEEGSAAAYAPSSPAGGQTYIHYMPVSAASPQGHPLPPPPPPPMVPPPLKTASLPAPPLSAASSSSSSSSSSQSYPAAAPAAVPAPFPA